MHPIKSYTICSSRQLGLEVERPEQSTNFSFFAILQDTRNILVFMRFLQAPYAEPVALFVKIPTRD